VRRFRVALVVVALALAGCSAVSPGTVNCVVSANNPHHSSGTPGQMVGKARMGCDTSGVTFTGYVEIQQQHNGGWFRYERAPFGPFATKKNDEYTRQASEYCTPGTFRTKVSAKATFGALSDSNVDYSQSVTNPC